jgi:hypothetical protein
MSTISLSFDLRNCTSLHHFSWHMRRMGSNSGDLIAGDGTTGVLPQDSSSFVMVSKSFVDVYDQAEDALAAAQAELGTTPLCLYGALLLMKPCFHTWRWISGLQLLRVIYH